MILDTNAVSAILTGEDSLRAIIERAPALFLPVICLGEYRYGISGSSRREEITSSFETLLRSVSLVSIDADIADEYACLRRELRDAGTPIPENDVWIAAVTRHLQLPLVSRDAHFDRIRGVRRIGW